jgi:hypothetical protein
MYQIAGGWHILLYFLTGGGNKNHLWFFVEIIVKIEITCDLEIAADKSSIAIPRRWRIYHR